MHAHNRKYAKYCYVNCYRGQLALYIVICYVQRHPSFGRWGREKSLEILYNVMQRPVDW